MKIAVHQAPNLDADLPQAGNCEKGHVAVPDDVTTAEEINRLPF